MSPVLRGVAVLTACVLLGASANSEEALIQAPQSGRSVELPVDLLRVEPQPKDERFEGVKLDPPKLNLELKFNPQDAGKPFARVWLDGEPSSVCFGEDIPLDWDGTRRQFVARPQALTYAFTVAYPSNDGRSTTGPGRRGLFKYYDVDGTFRDVPDQAYRWEDEADGSNRIVALPAAFERANLQYPFILIGAPGFMAQARQLKPRPSPNVGSTNQVQLVPLVKCAALPKVLAEKYPALRNSGICLSKRPEELSLPDCRWLWRFRDQPKPGWGGYCIFPGFLPKPTFVDNRGEARFRIRRNEDDWHEFGVWNSTPLVPATLEFVARRRIEGIPRDQDTLDITKMEEIAPSVGIYLDGTQLALRRLKLDDNFVSARFDLAELYDRSAAWATDLKRHLEAVDGFEALESRCEFRIIPSRPDMTMPYALDNAMPFGGSFETGSPKRIIFRQTRDTRPLAVEFSLVGIEIFVNVAAPEHAPANFRGSVRFYDETHSGKPIPEKLYHWNEGGVVRFYLPSLMKAGFSTRIRAEYPGSGPAEFDLAGARAGVDSHRRELAGIKFGPAGLRVILPAGLRADAAVVLRLTSSDSSKREAKINLAAGPTERVLSGKEFGFDPAGAAVDLFIPDHKPLIIPKLGGTVIDASHQESTVGTKFVVLVNNWSDIVTPNEVVYNDISALQQLVCEKTMSLAGEVKDVHASGFALVSPAEANWPKGDSAAKYLATGVGPPIARMARRDDNRPDEIWKHLRDLLSHPEVICQHGVVNLVLVTPLQLTFAPKDDDPNKAWLKERIESGRVQLKTIVIGGPEVRNLNAEKLAKSYFHPLVLKVGPNGVDYNGDGKDAGLELLDKWLKENVLK